MQIYKREEGMWARVPVAIIGGVVTVYATDAAMGLAEGNARFIWGGLVFAALGLATLFIAFFHRKTGDVLIDTESEMRKVVWPTREEVQGSTIVVIGTTVLLGLTILVMDIVLTYLFQLIRLYPRA